MSEFSDDILNSVQLPSQAFNFQAPEAAAALNAKTAKTSINQAAKKRKRNTVAAVHTKSYCDSKHYIQLAIDNLLLALGKETD